MYEDAILDYTAVDEVTVDEDVALKRMEISDAAPVCKPLLRFALSSC